MRILLLGSDHTALNPQSPLADRLREYGSLVTDLVVIVPSVTETLKVSLSPQVVVHGIHSSSKPLVLWHMFKLAQKVLSDWRGYDDVIISTRDGYFIGFLAALLSQKFKTGFELQVHGQEKLSLIRARLFEFVIGRASSIRVVSERLARILVERYRCSREQITVAPIYFNVELVTSRFDMAIPAEIEGFVFLTVGRLVPVKNIRAQIEALALLPRTSREIAKLVIVGDGPERPLLETLARLRGVADLVTFMGYQADLAPFYRRADCFMLSSKSEGWGIVLLEAAAASLPIITTEVGLVPEILPPGLGVTIVSSTPRDLAEAMTRALVSVTDRAALKAYYENHLRQLPTHDELLALYRVSWERALSFKRR